MNILPRLVSALIFACLAAFPARAQEASPPAFTEEVEQAARDVGKSLRCVVCQNQSIEDSGAPLAADMRQLVREQLAAGKSEGEVLDFMTERYGNFVLMKPPFQADTLLLWLGPLLFIALAAGGWALYLRPSRGSGRIPEPLTQEETDRLHALMPAESIAGEKHP